MHQRSNSYQPLTNCQYRGYLLHINWSQPWPRANTRRYCDGTVSGILAPLPGKLFGLTTIFGCGCF